MPEQPLRGTASTSIGLGAGEVVVVNIPMDDVRDMLQEGLATRTLLEFEIARDGAAESVIVNPLQVKVLQGDGGSNAA